MQMTRKKYDDYHYEDLDANYTYHNSCVLINKLDIRDFDISLEKEYRFSAERILELNIKPIFVHSMKDIKLIHFFIFQDMYTWAGEYRTVNITKSGNAFMARQSFSSGEEYIDALLSVYHKTANSKETIAYQLATLLDCLNHMHPFREGNGRCQREVVLSLALEKGFDLFLDIKNNDDTYTRYMDGTVLGHISILEALFLDTLEPIEE
jgi:cell filamentation protein